MYLNNIELSTFSEQGNEVTFLLACSLLDALALDGQTLTIVADGEPYKVFAGYSVVSVGVQGEYTAMRCMRKLDEATEAAINGLDAATAALGKQNDETAAVLAALLGGEQ